MIQSPAELLPCFRPIDRAEVEFDGLVFPLQIEMALAWTVGPRAFLVYRDHPTRPPKGIVFHRNPGAAPEAVTMCEWCYSVRGAGGVKLQTAKCDDRRRVGLYLCDDLACIERIAGLPGPDDLRDRRDVPTRVAQALGRIREFATRRLF
jgi:hypothetical protein